MSLWKSIKELFLTPREGWNYFTHKWKMVGNDFGLNFFQSGGLEILDEYKCTNCDITIFKDRMNNRLKFHPNSKINVDKFPSCNECVMRGVLE